MRRILGWLILLGFITFGLLWPLVTSSASGSAPADDPVVISNYDADFTVADDGTLNAVETITGRSCSPSSLDGKAWGWAWPVAGSNTSSTLKAAGM